MERAARRRTCSPRCARAAEDDAVRAVLITGAGRAFSSGADLKDVSGGRDHADGRPDVYRTLTERYHPIMQAIREMPKPVIARRQRPGRRHRLLAGALLRSDRRRRERLLPARVRQHRPGPRRRLVAVRAEPRGHGARERAGDARRASAGREGARVGPDQPRGRRRAPARGGRARSPRDWRRARRAPTPAPSAS